MIFIKRVTLLDVGSKVLSVLLLILQAALLDHFFIKFDEDNPARWVWIGADVVIVAIWISGLVLTSRNVRSKEPADSGNRSGVQKWMAIIGGEMQYAYFAWVFYSIILVAKVWYMFGDFAENFTSTGYYNISHSSRGAVKFQDSEIYSSTSLKVILSLTGPLFLLLAYAHHDEIHNSKYKLLMEKLGTTASLDVLDSLMLLGLLFINDTKILLSFNLDHAIKFFTCCCFVLPSLPLFILRIVGQRKAEDNNFRIILVINSALYLFLVNFPFLCIRCYLWFRHDVDISTFITKNVMNLFRGILDVYNEVRQWMKSKQPGGGVTTEGTSTEEPAIELAEKPTHI
ncbi:uncharacterized protein LOC129257453 [Lytechinus pictus]|uniref:uncharacterized protein LOC129257453 n=1 Tax=Lytechinus pictus TaxID=7653 RepID=UPI0030B9DD96